MSGTGFESTLQYVDFLPGSGLGQGSTLIVRIPDPQLSQTVLADRDAALEDLVRFHRQANGEGAREKVIQERIPGMVYAESPAPVGHNVAPADPHSQDNLLPSDMAGDVAALRAFNQLASQRGGFEGLTIADIRQIPGMRDQAEGHMTSFRDIIPALAPAPSAHPPGVPTQESPAAPEHHSQNSNTVGDDQTPASDELSAAKAQYEELMRHQAAAAEELKNLRLAQEREQAAVLLQQQAQARLQQQQLAARQAQQQAAALAEQKRLLAVAAAELKATQAAIQQHRQKQGQNSSVLTHGHRVTQQAPQTITTGSATVRATVQASQQYDYFVGDDGMMCRMLKPVPSPVPVAPTPSTRWEDRWSPLTGRKYQVQVSVPATPVPQMNTSSPPHVAVGIHPVTGQPYYTQLAPGRQQVPLANQYQTGHHHSLLQPSYNTQLHSAPLYQPDTSQLPFTQPTQPLHMPTTSPGQDQQMQQSQLGAANLSSLAQCSAGDQSLSDQLREKMKGIVKLVEKGDSHKKLKLIDYVRRCPTKWAKDVTNDNMNLPVYAYGLTSELVASLSGRSDPLPPSVILAKLQHMQNVFEICCQNSTLQEFNNYGWVLARDYSSKVQNKVEQQIIDWDQMSSGVQTADLVSAQCEFPRPVKKVDNADPTKKAPNCTTFNSCTTEKKCDYEVGHPGKVCQRKHECSYCRKHLNKGNKHQAWKCPNKQDN